MWNLLHATREVLPPSIRLPKRLFHRFKEPLSPLSTLLAHTAREIFFTLPVDSPPQDGQQDLPVTASIYDWGSSTGRVQQFRVLRAANLKVTHEVKNRKSTLRQLRPSDNHIEQKRITYFSI